jgi:lysophospholipase L1-like esterase
MSRLSRVLLSGACVAILAALGVGAGPAVATEWAPPPPVHRYVALGDSYTAAPFVPTIIPANGCYQSTSNYPHLVAAAVHAVDFVDASCSGADTSDVWASQLPGVPPQLDAVTSSTDLVTISLGGNDSAVFATLVYYCPTLAPSDPTGAPCRDAMRAGGQDRLLAAVATTRQSVQKVIAAVRERAPHARIEVVGYPKLLPSQGTCTARIPLATGDSRYVDQVNQRLTWALREAAAQAHVGYVDVWRASIGHDICSADPWINGQYDDPSRAAAFHPFANEQAAVARLIESAVD